jgi:hypothetical protein
MPRSIDHYNSGARPDRYPSDEFSRPNRVWYGGTFRFYELGRVVYAHTTIAQSVLLPQIEHRSLVDSGVLTSDGVAEVIPEAHLDDLKKRAVEKAAYLRSLREQGPPVGTFPYLRKLTVASDGLLWVCAPEEGIRMDQDHPQDAVCSASALGDITIASARYGGHPVDSPRYDQADLIEFVPGELADRANAYAFMCAGHGWRAVVGEGDSEYRIAQVRLFEVTTDLEHQPFIGQ